MRWAVAVIVAAGVLSYVALGRGLLEVLLAFGVAPATADTIATRAFLGGWAALLIGGGIWLLNMIQPSPSGVDVTHGSARFMSNAGTAKLTGDAGLIVGRDLASDKLLRFKGEGHLITIAPTRSGKGVGTIIPNLLTYAGPVVCIDPKGENAQVAASRRRTFGPVHVLDPFGASGMAGATYNPLDAIDPNSPDGPEDAAALADALVHDPPGQVHEAHWNEEAKALIAGLILHIASGRRDRRTLAQLRHLLTLPSAFFTALLDDMASSDAAGGLVARAANRHRGKADREAAGVLSSAQRHTHFLDSARVGQVMASSTFSLPSLAMDNASLFIVLPPDRLAHHSRWLRLMVVQVITALTRGGPRGRGAKPVLLLLDEFAALGRLEPVAQAMGLMAGYGLQLWPILQDIHQLRSLYGPDAGSFLSNAGCVQLFNVGDIDTADWVSRSLGDTTVDDLTFGALGEDGGALFAGPKGERYSAYGEHSFRRPLLTPDEVRRMPADEAILLLQGQPPVRAHKVRYYADTEFKGLLK